MCGINGIYDLKHQYTSAERMQIVHDMNNKIVYRGPDSEGIYENECLAMGMRRLSIIDLKSGKQPVYNEDHSLAIVYNGEIYNYRDIRGHLIRHGHNFYSYSDTEVILHAYEEFGNRAFKKLDGMFAFAIYDSRKKQLILARDPMGEKPLYYYQGRVFLWASELKSIMGTEIPEKRICKTALNQYFQLGYIPSPLTIYENVYKLQPGHYLILNADGTIVEKEYWSLKDIKSKHKLSYKQAKRKLKRLVEKSVKERMTSDVPAGVLLSGGIDSSIIAGQMSRLSHLPVNTFTIGFSEKAYDERARARLVAEKYNTNHHEYILKDSDVMLCMEDILRQMDEPFADSSTLPSYFVSKFAGKYVRVILTGDAGDELFLGYSKYLIGYYSRILMHFPKWMRNIFRRAVYLLPDESALSRKVRKVLSCCEMKPFEQYMQLCSLGFKENERKKLLRKEYYSENCMDFMEQRYHSAGTDLWKKIQYTDLTTVLEGDMLVKMDRMSMLNSVEARTPLLSKDIIEFAYMLPDVYKIKGRKLKRILKDTFKYMLPLNYTKLPKSGFGIPLDDWFREQLRGWIEQKLDMKKLEQEGMLNTAYVQEILEEHYTGRVNRKTEIWSLLVFEAWYEREIAV